MTTPFKDGMGRPSIEFIGATADSTTSTVGTGVCLLGVEFGSGKNPSTVVAGEYADLTRVPFALAMERYELLAYDLSGAPLAISAVVDVLVADFATNTFASITGTDTPTLSTASKVESTALTGWTLSNPVDTMYRFKLVSFTDASGTLGKIVLGIRAFAT